MNTSNERAMLSQIFPEIADDLMDDIFHQCNRNYQMAYTFIHSQLYPSNNNIIATTSSNNPPQQQIHLSDDQQIIQYWSEATLSEFQHVISRISVVQGLMGSSHMDTKMSILEQKIQTCPIQESIEQTIEKFVAASFGLKSPKKSRKFVGTDPGGLCGGNGNFYSGCKTLYDTLPIWQRPLLQAALHEIIISHNDDGDSNNSSRDRDGLQIICGLILRASRECNARKQDVFFKVIQHSVSNNDINDLNYQQRRTHDTHDHEIEYHKKTLFDAAMVSIDEIKDYAFKAIFLEPTKMYFRAVNDHTMEGDVDVHGSNTYLAILLATLGVKLSRSPLLDDEVKGIAQIKEALRANDLNKFWNSENKGASWELLLGTSSYPSYQKMVHRNRFYVSGQNPKEVAHNCNRRRHRNSIEPYLVAYANHFGKEKMVDILCKYFLSQDNLHCHLDALFAQLASSEEVMMSNGEAKYWLWDVMTGNFRRDRAYQLLCFAGILKEGI